MRWWHSTFFARYANTMPRRTLSTLKKCSFFAECRCCRRRKTASLSVTTWGGWAAAWYFEQRRPGWRDDEMTSAAVVDSRLRSADVDIQTCWHVHHCHWVSINTDNWMSIISNCLFDNILFCCCFVSSPTQLAPHHLLTVSPSLFVCEITRSPPNCTDDKQTAVPWSSNLIYNT